MTQRPNPLTGSTNELAKERNRAAAERTIAGWIQNSLTLIGFGLAVDQIAPAFSQYLPQQPALTAQLARLMGLSCVGTSIVLLGVALLQHWVEIKAIEQDDYVVLPSYPLNGLAIGAVLIFAGFAVVGILLSPAR
jgi:putative membrane protein